MYIYIINIYFVQPNFQYIFIGKCVNTFNNENLLNILLYHVDKDYV